MKTFVLILSIVFIVLTFIGNGYVLAHHGNVNAGYAVMPMVIALTCIISYKKIK